jgi:hypothetical protein
MSQEHSVSTFLHLGGQIDGKRESKILFCPNKSFFGGSPKEKKNGNTNVLERWVFFL